MERHLWDEQIIHVKTLETYYGALDTHKLEVTDTEILARNMKIARLDTEAKLQEINEKTQQRLIEMEFAHKQREEYTREMENKTRRIVEKIQQAKERPKEHAVGCCWLVY